MAGSARPTINWPAALVGDSSLNICYFEPENLRMITELDFAALLAPREKRENLLDTRGD